MSTTKSTSYEFSSAEDNDPEPMTIVIPTIEAIVLIKDNPTDDELAAAGLKRINV